MKRNCTFFISVRALPCFLIANVLHSEAIKRERFGLKQDDAIVPYYSVNVRAKFHGVPSILYTRPMTFNEGVFIQNDFVREFSSIKVLDAYFAFSGDSQASHLSY